MNHTPGPWSVGHQLYSTMPVYADGAQGVAVADCAMNATYGRDGSYAITSAEMEANAKLIAAAPEMLEALKKVAHAQYMCNNRHEPSVTDGDCACARASAEEAVNAILSKLSPRDSKEEG